MPQIDRGGSVWADVFQVAGFALAVAGLALVSVPIALVTAGVTLFVVGGLAARR